MTFGRWTKVACKLAKHAVGRYDDQQSAFICTSKCLAETWGMLPSYPRIAVDYAQHSASYIVSHTEITTWPMSSSSHHPH
jgi:hypothetical protein